MEDHRIDIHTDEDDIEVEDGGAAAAAQAQGPSLDSVTKERNEIKDLLLRKTAEFDNFRKRTERERISLSEAAAADLIGELLPLVDNFERALSADTGPHAVEAYRRGVELIHTQLGEVLRKRGVRPVDSVGNDFDPNYHQAVVHEPAPGRRDGEVLEELQRGYLLGDRLLRPAMVKVAKGES